MTKGEQEILRRVYDLLFAMSFGDWSRAKKLEKALRDDEEQLRQTSRGDALLADLTTIVRAFYLAHQAKQEENKAVANKGKAKEKTK